MFCVLLFACCVLLVCRFAGLLVAFACYFVACFVLCFFLCFFFFEPSGCSGFVEQNLNAPYTFRLFTERLPIPKWLGFNAKHDKLIITIAGGHVCCSPHMAAYPLHFQAKLPVPCSQSNPMVAMHHTHTMGQRVSGTASMVCCHQKEHTIFRPLSGIRNSLSRLCLEGFLWSCLKWRAVGPKSFGSPMPGYRFGSPMPAPFWFPHGRFCFLVYGCTCLLAY